jgi:Rieske Fe-S protein
VVRRGRAVAAASIAVGALALGIGVVLFVRSTPEHRVWPSSVPLSEVPEGVTAWTDGDRHGGFLVRDGQDVLLLSDRSPHLGAPVGWCPRLGVFVDVLYGSYFDRSGRYIGGPSPRGLDRLGLVVIGDVARFEPQRSEPGPPASDRGDPPTGDLNDCVNLVRAR